MRAEWKGDNPTPCPVAHTAFVAAQFTFVFLGCKCLLVHVELLIKHPHILFRRAVLNTFFIQLVFVLWIALAWLKLMRFAQAHLSSLFGSLCILNHKTFLFVVISLSPFSNVSYKLLPFTCISETILAVAYPLLVCVILYFNDDNHISV